MCHLRGPNAVTNHPQISHNPHLSLWHSQVGGGGEWIGCSSYHSGTQALTGIFVETWEVGRLCLKAQLFSVEIPQVKVRRSNV